MNNSMAVVLIIVFVGAVVLTKWVMNIKKEKKALAKTLNLVSKLKTIISLTQKHRGLNATFLQGNQSVMKDIEALRKSINQISNEIAQDSLLKSEPRWEAYLDHWSRLRENCLNLSAPQSFKQHTSLIETMLYLLQDIAEHVELADKNGKIESAYFLWREFPQLVEFVGQSRAVGVGTATKGISTQIDKVKLGYLSEKITSMMASILNKLNNNANCVTSLQIEKAKSACETLTTIIKTELIDVDKVTYNSTKYFELASTAMDQCNTILEAELEFVRKVEM